MRSLNLLRPTSADEGLSLLKYLCDMLCAGLIDRLVVVLYRAWTRKVLKNRPGEHTIIATLVVVLYTSFFSFLALSGTYDRLESSRYAEMIVNYCNPLWFIFETFTLQLQCPF
jgi:hypothetical protein